MKLDQKKNRTLTLIKHGHTYLFRFLPGQEEPLLQLLAQKAQDQNHPLDWFDAATLSHQISPRAATILQRLAQKLSRSQHEDNLSTHPARNARPIPLPHLRRKIVFRGDRSL